MAKKAIKECPHCGGTSGLYTKTTYVDVPYRFGFNKEEQDNSEMYDNTAEFRGGKTAYCQDCHKAVCQMRTLEKLWGEGKFQLTD